MIVFACDDRVVRDTACSWHFQLVQRLPFVVDANAAKNHSVMNAFITDCITAAHTVPRWSSQSHELLAAMMLTSPAAVRTLSANVLIPSRATIDRTIKLHRLPLSFGVTLALLQRLAEVYQQ